MTFQVKYNQTTLRLVNDNNVGNFFSFNPRTGDVVVLPSMVSHVDRIYYVSRPKLQII